MTKISALQTSEKIGQLTFQSSDDKVARNPLRQIHTTVKSYFFLCL